MKFSLLKNDKTTCLDEVVLALMIIVSIVIGVLLFVYRPSFWFVSSSVSCGLGVLLTLYGVMFIPGFIYRLMTNE